MDKKSKKIAIIGLGYVGINLCVKFGKYFETIGYDINKQRVKELSKKKDITNEVTISDLKNATKLKFTDKIAEISDCNFKIIAVPTPVNKKNLPDLSYLKKSTQDISPFIKKGDIIVYESTTFPGCTNKVCGNIIINKTKLKLNEDFYLGYSPERVNPADKKNNLSTVPKIVSASNKFSLKKISDVYSKIIKAGIIRVKNIETAEASKLIENIQRDINIALMNEFSIICKKINLDVYEVIKAASTKWNFLPFNPGFVGGHCISVDPYYMNYISLKNSYKPKVLMAGREINEKMSYYASKEIIKRINELKSGNNRIKIGVLGVTFKENCPDTRNSKIFNIINSIKSFSNLVVHDPMANPKDTYLNYKVKLSNFEKLKNLDMILICVGHNFYRKLTLPKIEKMFSKKKRKIIFDFKNIFKEKNFSSEFDKITL